jgi:structural maintenance of chromosome 4
MPITRGTRSLRAAPPSGRSTQQQSDDVASTPSSPSTANTSPANSAHGSPESVQVDSDIKTPSPIRNSVPLSMHFDEEKKSSPTERKPRLMIQKMVLENFKSYAGTKNIGPFHKVCTLIVSHPFHDLTTFKMYMLVNLCTHRL